MATLNSSLKHRRKRETPFDRRLLWLVLGSGAPAIATAMTLLCVDDFTTRTRCARPTTASRSRSGYCIGPTVATEDRGSA